MLYWIAASLKLKNIDQSQQEGVYSSMKKLYDEYISPGVTTILECNQAISQVLFPGSSSCCRCSHQVLSVVKSYAGAN